MSYLKILRGEKSIHPDMILGSCSIEHPLLKDYQERMLKILPDAKYLTVIAAAHTDSALRSPNIQVKQYDTIFTYNRVRDVSMLMAREIEMAGYSAVAIPAFIPIDMLGEGKGMQGEICWRRAGVAAGLGFVGKNNLLVTKEFGPRIRVGGVLTSYPLPEDSVNREGRSNKNKCGNCQACIENCPTGALSEFAVNKKKCGDYIFSYGLRSFSNFLKELTEVDEHERKKLVSSSTARELWQNFMTGCYYYCWECQMSCPVGNTEGRQENCRGF